MIRIYKIIPNKALILLFAKAFFTIIITVIICAIAFYKIFPFTFKLTKHINVIIIDN